MLTTRASTKNSMEVLIRLEDILDSHSISHRLRLLRIQLQKNQKVNESIYKIIFMTELIGEFESILVNNCDERAPKHFFEHLQQFLLNHWAVIRNDATLHYQYNPTFYINKVCIELAVFVANELGLNCAELLYPDLVNDTSGVTWTSIIELDRLKETPPLPPVLPNVVLSDCGKYFIEIDICLQNAIADGVLKHTQKMVSIVDPVTSKEVRVMALLSPTEIERVTAHNRYAANLYKAINDVQRCKYESPTLGSCIAALIAGLNDGSVERDSQLFRTGAEGMAGLQANAAIAAFVQIIEGLPEELRAELRTMRDAHNNFDFHLNDLSNNDHARKISDKQSEIDQMPRAKAFQLAQLALDRFHKVLPATQNKIRDSGLTLDEQEAQLAKLIHDEKMLKATLAETKAILDANDRQKLVEFNKLSTHIGRCVAQTAKGWQGLLDNNRARLYNMTFDGSVGVGSQLVVMEARVQEYWGDLYHYLNKLYPYLQSLEKGVESTVIKKEFGDNFHADCNNVVGEDLYAKYILKWLANCQNEKALIAKLGKLVDSVKQRPQLLIESRLLSNFTDNYVRLLVQHFTDDFTLPIVSAICKAGSFTLDNGECCERILKLCVLPKADTGFLFPAENHGRQSRGNEFITLNITRLLFALPGFNPLLESNGFNLLGFAVAHRHCDLITLLIAKGASRKLSPLRDVMHDALNKDDLDVVKALLPSLQKDDTHVLQAVCKQYGETTCELFFQRLLDLGWEPAELAEIFFQFAHHCRNERALVFAIDKGAINAINSPDVIGSTPLLNFIIANQAKAVRRLIQSGANVEYVNPVTKRDGLMEAISILWLNGLEKSCKSHWASQEICAERLQEYVISNGNVLEAILGVTLPAAIVQDIKNNMLQWILQHISLDAFEHGIISLRGRGFPNLFQQIIQLLDLMTDEQHKCLMDKYFDNHIRLALTHVFPQTRKYLLEENNCLGQLQAIISDSKFPLRIPLILFMLHHPTIIQAKVPILHMLIPNEPFLFERLLVHPGIDINARHAIDGVTAVLRAVKCGALGMLEKLVERGARLDGCDNDDNNVFHYIMSNDTWILKFLLRCQFSAGKVAQPGAMLNQDLIRKLLLAKNKNGYKALALILKYIDIQQAIAGNYFGIFRHIVGQEELFDCAIHTGSIEIVRQTFDASKPLSDKTLKIACEHFDEKVMTFLCEQYTPGMTDAEQFEFWQLLFMWSIKLNSHALCQLVTTQRHVINLTARNAAGNTPLMEVARAGSIELLEALLAAGANDDVAHEQTSKKAWDYARERLIDAFATTFKNAESTDFDAVFHKARQLGGITDRVDTSIAVYLKLDLSANIEAERQWRESPKTWKTIQAVKRHLAPEKYRYVFEKLIKQLDLLSFQMLIRQHLFVEPAKNPQFIFALFENDACLNEEKRQWLINGVCPETDRAPLVECLLLIGDKAINQLTKWVSAKHLLPGMGDSTLDLNTAMKIAVNKGDEKLIMLLLQIFASARAENEALKLVMEHARTMGKDKLCALIAVNELEKCFAIIKKEPLFQTSKFATSFISSASQAASPREQQLTALQWMIDTIQAYIINEEYRETDLNTALIRADTKSKGHFKEKLSIGRLRVICHAIMGEAAFDKMSNNNSGTLAYKRTKK